MTNRFIFILGLLLNCLPLYAEDSSPLVLWKGDQDEVDLRPYLDYVSEDSSHKTSIDEWAQAQNSQWFQSLGQKGPKFFGYSDQHYWFRFAVQNASFVDQDLIIGSVRPEHSAFDIYVIRANGEKRLYRTGSSIPWAQRPLASRLCLAPLHLMKGEVVTIYFSLQSKQSISLQFSMMTAKKALQIEKIEDCSLFFYFGAISLLVLYSLFLGFSLNQITYHLYSLFGVTIGFCTFVYAGYLEMLGFSLPLVGGSADTPRILLIPTICSGVYCHRFFRLGELAPKLGWLSLGVIALASVSALLNMSPWGSMFRQLIPLSQMALFFSILAMVYAGLRAKAPGAGYQALAWGVFFVTSVVWALGNEGVIEKNYPVAFAVLYGNVFEMLMGAIALGAYVRDLERKKFDAKIKEQESQNLRTLVFVVCHDIANPLMVIQGAATYLQSALAGMEKPLRMLSKVQHGADIITSIIEQVRRLEAVRSGKYKPQLQAVSVGFLFQELRFLFVERATAKGVTLQFLDENLPADLAVQAEPTSLLNDVLNNFISNAIKFSESGQTVTLAVEFDDRLVRILVKDQGIGMPQKIVEKLFDAGASTSRRGTQNEAGTGFGMPLAKYFVDCFEGRIDVQTVEKIEGSTADHGTTILTTLKRKELTGSLTHAA